MIRGRPSAVTAAIRSAGPLLPDSGEIEHFLELVSADRGRPLVLLVGSLDDSVSGALISTPQADYIAVSDHASPERLCAIVCHEVAHLLMGHDHGPPLSQSLFDSGLLGDIDPELAKSVVATRCAYDHPDEVDAEVVATHISVELRRRVMRGGHTFYDDRWR